METYFCLDKFMHNFTFAHVQRLHQLNILCCWYLFSLEMRGDVTSPIIICFLFRGKCQCDLIKLTFLRPFMAVNFSQKKITHMC